VGDPFTVADINLHWGITEPPSETSFPTSSVGGRSELIGVRPIRLYKGTPVETQIWTVPPVVLSADSVAIVRTEEIGGVRQGVKQPYEVVRKGWTGISSPKMASQGRINGLYYADIPVVSLGHTAAHNAPSGARAEPEFGTYASDGYWFDVRDPNLTFSPREQTDLVFSTHMLPTTSTPLQGNRVPLLGKTVTIDYDYSPLVDRVQGLFSSESDRNLCSETLVRHFLPSYIYIDGRYQGTATPGSIASRMRDQITSLNPTDELTVSSLEQAFAANQVSNYSHPITLIAISHDWDRRIVESSSEDRLGDLTLDFNGTNRTTYFIPGTDRSSAATEEEIPDGERIYLASVPGRSSL